MGQNYKEKPGSWNLWSPIGLSLVRNDRKAKKVKTFSLREMKGEEKKEKKDSFFIKEI